MTPFLLPFGIPLTPFYVPWRCLHDPGIRAHYATDEDYFMGEMALCGWSHIAKMFGVSMRTMQRKKNEDRV